MHEQRKFCWMNDLFWGGCNRCLKQVVGTPCSAPPLQAAVTSSMLKFKQKDWLIQCNYAPLVHFQCTRARGKHLHAAYSCVRPCRCVHMHVQPQQAHWWGLSSLLAAYMLFSWIMQTPLSRNTCKHLHTATHKHNTKRAFEDRNQTALILSTTPRQRTEDERQQTCRWNDPHLHLMMMEQQVQQNHRVLQSHSDECSRGSILMKILRNIFNCSGNLGGLQFTSRNFPNDRFCFLT